MNSYFRLLTVFALLIWVNLCSAQNRSALSRAHSHNDYSQPIPFSHAYQQGFGAIEADVFLVNGKLFVAHDRDRIQQSRTLTAQYLQPLKEALAKDVNRKITLLIDLKDDYHTSLTTLIRELEPLQMFIKNAASAGRLRILISGNRPPPAAFKNYPDYLSFDEDLMHTYKKDELGRISQISLRFSNYSKWKGIGPLPEPDALALQTIIHAAHTLNKPVRFWDAPDNATGWAKLIELGVDIIGTDNIDALASFLETTASGGL